MCTGRLFGLIAGEEEEEEAAERGGCSRGGACGKQVVTADSSTKAAVATVLGLLHRGKCWPACSTDIHARRPPITSLKPR